MSAPSEKRLEIDLKRLAQVKQAPAKQTPLLGPDLVAFFKQNVEKRQA